MLRHQVALVVARAAAPDEAVLDARRRTAADCQSPSVPGAIGTTSWCAISAIGCGLRVAAGPGVEQAVLADHLALAARRAPSGSSAAGSACRPSNSAAFAVGIVERGDRLEAHRARPAAAAAAARRPPPACAGATASWRDGMQPASSRRPPTASARTTTPQQREHACAWSVASAVQLKRLAFGRQLREQRRRLPERRVVVRVLGEALHRLRRR